jgi:hypothetical protein
MNLFTLSRLLVDGATPWAVGACVLGTSSIQVGVKEKR